LGIEQNSGGLVDYLEHPALGIQSVIYTTGVPRLRLLPAGRSRDVDGEYFSSFRLRAALDSLRSRYIDRYLFLDGPPVIGAPDARILSELADVVVLVAGYGRDTAQAISQAAAVFDPAIFAGVVFNERP
jgi:MinD-like ATPase involved in chromosome partitioning or flagellar assembly